MAKFFNTAGPCRQDLHSMLPAEARLVAGALILFDARTTAPQQQRLAKETQRVEGCRGDVLPF